MDNSNGITHYFGGNLAELLTEKIVRISSDFDGHHYIEKAYMTCEDLGYTQRIVMHAELLHAFLPQDFVSALDILMAILGPENPNETGMFSEFYWVMPLGKYIEMYGVDSFEDSMRGIEAITKRGTGEYAIRTFIRKYPDRTLGVMRQWAVSDSFHLRRLASEGLRPKLPWATKLDVFIDNPDPVFDLLNLLKEDPVMFVKKSVANHLTDWIKVNPVPTQRLINEWRKSNNKHTQWILKRATRGMAI
jgi:3-methyladenine DNA glycosylase AlkC